MHLQHTYFFLIPLLHKFLLINICVMISSCMLCYLSIHVFWMGLWCAVCRCVVSGDRSVHAYAVDICTAVICDMHDQAQKRRDVQQIEPITTTRRAGAETNHGPSPPRFWRGRILYLVNGWCEKKLSVVGREILIKAVAQSIPTYSMSCFQPSKTTCKEITLAISRF